MQDVSSVDVLAYTTAAGETLHVTAPAGRGQRVIDARRKQHRRARRGIPLMFLAVTVAFVGLAWLDLGHLLLPFTSESSPVAFPAVAMLVVGAYVYHVMYLPGIVPELRERDVSLDVAESNYHIDRYLSEQEVDDPPDDARISVNYTSPFVPSKVLDSSGSRRRENR